MNYNFLSVMTNPTNPMPFEPPRGYRFHPTDEQLINNYLKPKMLGDDVEDLLFIAEVNLCKHEPWDLPDKSIMKSIIKSDDRVWYFLCRRDFKYKKSRRSNRRTKLGYWKPTGKITEIKDTRTKKVIGTKKNLVFYQTAHPKPLKTEWSMQEYDCISDSTLTNQREYVLSKLKNKSNEKTSKGEPNRCMASLSDFEAQPGSSMASDFENQNHSELTANSACDESESSHHLASDFENQNSNELMSNLAYEGSGFSHSMASNYEIQFPNQQIVDSAYNGSEQSYRMASDPENQELIMASDFEDPLSPLQLEGECGPSVQMPFKFINHSTYGKGKTSSLLVSDFENQDQDKETHILSPNEGERSSLAMPLDLENQIPREKIDMSTLEEGCLHCPMVSPENSPADASLPEFLELSPQLWANLRAFLERD